MLYLHIGAPKTGTNAIQRFIQTHQERLAEMGLVYPELGRDGRHKHDALKIEFQAVPGLGGAAFEQLRGLLAAQPDQKVFVSEEAFYHFDQAQVQRLAAGMLGGGPVKILVWFRDYASHAVSIYGQAAKAGRRVVDFDTFFESYMQWPRHADAIGFWGEAFGWDKLSVRYYSAETLVNGDAVADCLGVLGIDRVAVESGGGESASKANASPGWQSVEMTRAVCEMLETLAGVKGSRRISTELRTAVRKAAEAAAPEPTRIEYLTEDQRRRCNEATLRDIEQLNRHLVGPTLPTPTLRDGPARAFLPTVAHVPGDVVAKAMASLAWELGSEMGDAKRDRKRQRLEKVAGTKEERRAARVAAGGEARPSHAKAPGKARKRAKAGELAGGE
jgi:hypothetical protein